MCVEMYQTTNKQFVKKYGLNGAVAGTVSQPKPEIGSSNPRQWLPT